MEISQFILAQLWLCALFLGAGLGAVYDVLSITRVFLGVPFTPWSEKIILSTKIPLLKHRTFPNRPPLRAVLCFFEDLFFLLAASVSLILLFYQFNEGNIRIPVILFALVGFWGYRITVGRMIRPCIELLCLFAINFISYISYYLVLPVRKLFYLLRLLLKEIYRKKARSWERKQRIRHTKAEEQKLRNSACGMRYGKAAGK